MSNYEDWERRNAVPFGCAVVVTILSFLAAAFFLGYPISRWLFHYPEEMHALPLLAFGVFFLAGAVSFTWRLAKGKPIPSVGRGGEAPPTVEIYDFLPKDTETVKRKEIDGPGAS